MRIVIVGAGLVGTSLAEYLLKERHDVSIIEANSDTIERVRDKFDLLFVEGSGSNPRVLHEAGIANADLLLAVSPDDEVNLLACSFAAQAGVSKRIARIRDLDYIHPPIHINLESLGVTQLIDPEQAVVNSIVQYILTPGAMEAASFENGRILLREYSVTPEMPIAGKNLMEFQSLADSQHILLMTIVRNDKAIIPSGEIVIEAGDEILALFPLSSRSKFLEMLNVMDQTAKKIIISGDNLTTFKLAQSLDGRADEIIWACQNREYGRWAADRLDRVEILHGDCTEIELLKEIHAERAEFFIACSKNTEHNVLAALLAKSQGVRETIAISDQPPKSDRLLRSVGIDHIINPRLTAAISILDHVHRGHMLSEIRIRDMDLEAIRMLAGPNSRITELPLNKAWKPLARKAIVGAIIRGEQLLIPRGDTHILPGDQAIIVARTQSIPDLVKVFKER